MILIDRPIWPNHGTVFAHLISDTSTAELHAFATSIGVPQRAFDGDHYDVPVEYVARAVAAGATVVEAAEIVRRLRQAGLRLRKRRGERGVARLVDVELAVGMRGDVDLVLSDRPAPAAGVAAAVVVLGDAAGSLLVVHSIRRGTWDPPGGRCEPGETARQCAVREVAEETGLVLEPSEVRPVGYERVHRPGRSNARPYLQVFRAQLDRVAPTIRPCDEHDDAAWLSPPAFAERCGERFWYPLVERVLRTY